MTVSRFLPAYCLILHRREAAPAKRVPEYVTGGQIQAINMTV